MVVEQFESRFLMAGEWLPAGPFGATEGQVEGIVNRPVVGAMNTILPHPTNPDIMWVGAVNGGVWRTDNATSPNPNWVPLFDDQASLSIGSMALDSTNDQIVYAGIGRYSSYAQIGGSRSGLFRSNDGGTTWNSVAGNNLLSGKNIAGIVANGNTVVVSVNVADAGGVPSTGIFRSTNGGNTFVRVNGAASGLPSGSAYDLTADPVNPSTMYTSVVFPTTAGTQGIYKSTNNGATWSRISTAAMNGLFGATTSNIEIAVGRQNNLFVGIINRGAIAGLFHSPDGGVSWQSMDLPKTNENGVDVGLHPSGGKGPTSGTPAQIAGGQGSIHFAMAADPNFPNIVYVGGDRQPLSQGPNSGSWPNSIGARDFTGRLFRGDALQPAGSQFVHLTHSNTLGALGGGTASNSSPHADARDMAFDAAGNLIEVDDGGIYRRTLPRSNRGDWFSMIGNLQTTEAHDVTYDNNSNVIITGNQDTGTTYQPSEGDTLWRSLSTADGGDVVVDNRALASQQLSIRYSSFQNLGAFRRTVFDASGAIVSTTFPTLNVTSGAPLTPAFRSPLAVNEVAGNRLIVQGFNSVYESLNQGNSLIEVGAGLGTLGQIENDAIVYGGFRNGVAEPDVLWVGSGSNVFLRQNASQPLTQTTGDPTNNLVLDLAVDPDDWQRAIIVTRTEVFASTALGASWSNITSNLFPQVSIIHSVVTIGAGTRVILVGTDRGVYSTSLDTPGEWTKVGTKLPNAIVFEMDYDATDDVLIAGTMGRGAWRLPEASLEFNTSPGLDFGDAPASYKTTLADQGPRHRTTGPTLGTLRDLDINGRPTALADGDDAAFRDDEDGVVFERFATLGDTFPVLVNAPTGGVLNAWFDFNRNGQFEASEHVISERFLAMGDNGFDIAVPANGSQGTSVARFRITSGFDMGNTPTGLANDGEVEDHTFNIRVRPPGVTNAYFNGGFTNPNRSGIGSITLKFDQRVTVSQKNSLLLVNRTLNTLPVNLTNSILRGNGTDTLTWELPGNMALLPNGRYSLELPRTAALNGNNELMETNFATMFHVRRGDVNGDGIVNNQDSSLVSTNNGRRVDRFSNGDANGDTLVNSLDAAMVSSSFNSVAFATIGLDYGDALEIGTNFPTTLARNGARHGIVSGGPRLGASVDAESNATANATASGDGADENGVTIPSITAGTSANISVSVSGIVTGSGFLNGWIDFNGDGDWNDAGERWIADVSVTNGSRDFPILFSADSPNKVFARFRITSIAGYAAPYGFAATGEVEDYLINIATVVQPTTGLLLTSNQGSGGNQNSNLSTPSLLQDSRETLGRTGAVPALSQTETQVLAKIFAEEEFYVVKPESKVSDSKNPKPIGKTLKSTLNG